MDFSNGPLVKAPYFHCRGTGLVPGGGSKIPQKRSREIKERRQVLEVWLLREARGETIEWTVVPRKGKGTSWKKGRRQ